MRFIQKTSVIFVALMMSACVASSTYHTATPIEEGTLEIGVMPGLYGIAAEGTSIALPMVELGIRTGLSENVDLGVRLNGLTVNTDVNIALINTPTFAMSIDPAITLLYFGFGEGSIFWTFTTVGLLFDVVKSESMTLMLGLKPGFIYAGVSGTDEDNETISASGNGFTIGATAGMKFRISNSFALMPCVDILSPVENFGVGLIFNAGLGLLF